MDSHVVLRAAMHLRMADLASWRAADTFTRTTLDIEGEENAWRYSAQSQFTSDRLFCPYWMYTCPQRTLCFKFHSLFQRANYMLSSDPLFVEEVEEAKLIERRLREAFCVCSAHHASSGRDSQVLLGSFCLQGAKETLFQLGGEEMQPTIAGLPPGVLAIKLCLADNSLMTWAAYGVLRDDVMELCQDAVRKQLKFNVCSADCDVSMTFRGLPLVLDGRWRSWKCPTSHCRIAETYDGWPVLCAFTILEVVPCEPRPQLANALNLEAR
eukprot:TRINITY_DN6063_c0_g1_i3.p1 TRINITY_DN6063_c0_g1~~TRINITY_DN6063_c0_g1_i3.p1  ORF type:complete len:286 (-),score=44.74 TRINITY_DN6063_c0_g1_i3:524-1327(-)